jgi:arylsulfatase A-like enzyme
MNFKIYSILIILLVILPNQLIADNEPSRPNIVIIFTDDQGWGDIVSFGLKHGKTPHLDRMSDEGMKFTQFYVNCAQCSGSRAALMTGCHYQRISMPKVSGQTKAEVFIRQRQRLPKC